MQAQILTFPGFTEAERRAMAQPPDPDIVRFAENLLIAALYNYRRAVTGESEHFVSYGEVPPIKREYFYRNWAVPAAVEAIWKEGA